MTGGIALGLGNLVSQYAWAFAGLSVTNIICASLTVVLGTTINYFLDGRINRAEILFPGVACFLVAVFLGAAVHSSNAKDDEEKLSVKCRVIGLTSDVADTDKAKLLPNPEDMENYDYEDEKTSGQVQPGTAEFIIQVEERRSIKVFGSNRLLGLSLVFLAGTCFSLFSPAINLAINDQWHVLRKSVPHLGVYTAFFYFSVSCFALGVSLNLWFLYRPMAGVPASTIAAYARDWNGRHWPLLAGLLCGFGNGFQFMGGQAAGYAAADAVPVPSSVSAAVFSLIQISDLISGLHSSGVISSQHILGSNTRWGIQEIVKENLPVAHCYAVNVRHGSHSPHFFSGEKEGIQCPC
ncbi:hypothetical protein QOZ80_5AG0391580 [Eleusine coracana subsp. coracana]|nr:hypothetical protein QOZ80_5AG0391580 [Eleusine coracana subsp. coracana]